MDWYYPVLSGALTGEAAKARLAEGWDVFAMEGRGIRCVSDEPWVTASETAECALAFAAIGDRATASDLLRWTRAHRREDGSYWTGLVYDATAGAVRFPFEEHTSYTAAAVVLAADAIAGASPASALFTPAPTPRLSPSECWSHPSVRARRPHTRTPMDPNTRMSVDSGEDAQGAGRRAEAEAAALQGGDEDLLVGRAATVGGVGEDVVDRQRPADGDVRRPPLVVGALAGSTPCPPSMNTSAAGVDQCRATSGDRPTTATTWSSSPASWIVARKNGSVSINPVRSSTTVGSCHSHPAWFSSEPRWWSTANTIVPAVPGRRAQPHRRAPAVRADLDERRAGHGGRRGEGRGVQGVALLRRHEPLRRQGVPPPVVRHRGERTVQFR